MCFFQSGAFHQNRRHLENRNEFWLTRNFNTAVFAKISRYGDTAPRSVPARLYSILWMIIGMIAFSVLTANITSSLSQKSFDSEEKMFGKRVRVRKITNWN
jgi:hypothetical protein